MPQMNQVQVPSLRYFPSLLSIVFYPLSLLKTIDQALSKVVTKIVKVKCRATECKRSQGHISLKNAVFMEQ